jgi:hypothetical protein
MPQSRHYTYPVIAFVCAMRKLVLACVLGLMVTVGIVVLIAPARTLDFMRGKIGAEAPVELIDTQLVISTVGDVQSTEVLVHVPPPIADRPRESPKRDEQACDVAMWSSLKEKCLSFAKRRKHRRNAKEGAAYFTKPVVSFWREPR